MADISHKESLSRLNDYSRAQDSNSGTIVVA